MRKSTINQGIDKDGLLIKETILCQPEFAATITPAWFTADFYAEYARPVSQGGRNAAWFIDTLQAPESDSDDLPSLQAVLRQYRRGGMVAKISRSHYVWGGAEQTRSWAELRLLQQMYSAGLPVPKPLAAYYQQHLGFYQAAILTQTIPHSQTLVNVLQSAQAQGLSQEALETLAAKVAQAIHQMHAFKVCHADLNAFNIMVDRDSKIWLLDFDKSRYNPSEKNWPQNNLQRLQRHLLKTCGEQGLAFWSQINEKYQKI